MTIKEANKLKIGTSVITKKGIKGEVIQKVASIGLSPTIYVDIKTDDGIIQCSHKELFYNI